MRIVQCSDLNAKDLNKYRKHNKRGLKMPGSLVILLLLFQMQEYVVRCIRLTELRAPAQVAEGGEALLGCQFDMENDILYSVKWYKDGREFYRYVPNNSPPVGHFTAPGVTVDVTRSSSNVVTLVNITRRSSGLYRCEVSGEAPLFATKYDQKYVTVYVLPETPPQISGLRKRYKIGDRLTAKCKSTGSQPEAYLKWLINNHPAPRNYVHGPWIKVSNEKLNCTDTSLHLSFLVGFEHYVDGILAIKCQATIAPLYQQETIHQIRSPLEPTHPSLKEKESFDDLLAYISQYGTSTAAYTEETTFQIEEPATDDVARSSPCFWLDVMLLAILAYNFNND